MKEAVGKYKIELRRWSVCCKVCYIKQASGTSFCRFRYQIRL